MCKPSLGVCVTGRYGRQFGAAKLALAISLVLLASCQDDPTERIFVVDQNAGPGGHGAVFELDVERKTLRMFASSADWRQPQDILRAADGSLLVLDYFDEAGIGKIFRVSADGTRCEELQIPKGLVDPFQFERAADGSIWIVDKNADPLNLCPDPRQQTGTLWRLSPDYTKLEIIATGPPLEAPSALFFVGAEAFLMDADAFQKKPVEVANEEGGIFRVHEYPARLETVVRFQKLLSPLSVHREASGSYLIVDVNADPVERDRIRGAIYRVDPITGTTTLFATHAEFRDPVNCLPWADRLLVADPNADPLKLGHDGSNYHYGGKGRGGIYEVDLRTGAVSPFFASPKFVNPIRLRWIGRGP